MSNNLNLGQLITTPQQKDCVHIAVAPVVAANDLQAGEFVKLDSRGHAYSCGIEVAIGIVDPFLTQNINKGNTFWLFLKPGSITSLRHDWSHPAFDNKSAPKHMTDLEHRDWIQNFANKLDVSYAELLEAAMDSSDGVCYFGTSINTPSKEEIIEFWYHYNLLFGYKPEIKEGVYFTCAC